MKFLVIWSVEVSRFTPEVIKAVMEQPNYGKELQADGKIECRYHIVGSHGGAWIYCVKSNEELDMPLAAAANLQLREVSSPAVGRDEPCRHRIAKT